MFTDRTPEWPEYAVTFLGYVSDSWWFVADGVFLLRDAMDP